MRLFRALSSHLLCLLLVSPVLASGLSGKKILYIDSYHAGYAWSDGIDAGVRQGLKDSGVELRVHRMDTKRNKSEAFKQQAALRAKALIEEFAPDLVITADDNAAKYLVQPYLAGGGIPVVFCGINWDASAYGLPTENVTGMLEVNDVDSLVHLLEEMAAGERIGFIGGDTLTNRKEVDYYRNTFGIDVIPYFAKDFEDFKLGYLALQTQSDMLIFYNFVAIEGWEHAAAVDFLRKHTRIPSGTFQQGVLPYAVVGYLKVPQEQGLWAAETAKKILSGAAPTSIKVINNTEARLSINTELAAAANLEVPLFMRQIAAQHLD